LALGQRSQIAVFSGIAVLTSPPRAVKSRGKTIRDQFRAIACGCSSGERSLLPVDALSASSSSPCALPGRPGPRCGWLFLPRGLRNIQGYNWPVKAGPNWKNCEALVETVSVRIRCQSYAANNRGSTSFATSSALRVFLRSNSSATACTDTQLSSIRSRAPTDAARSRASNCSTEVEMYSNSSEACKRSECPPNRRHSLQTLLALSGLGTVASRHRAANTI
jgi:hypothetical protein